MNWKHPGASLLLALAACGPAATPTPRDASVAWGRDAGTPTVACEGADAGPLDRSKLLGTSHAGWAQARCSDCHGKEPQPHQGRYAAGDCALCHGGNGAVVKDHAVVENGQCAECHGNVDHVATYRAPCDCIRCHQP